MNLPLRYIHDLLIKRFYLASPRFFLLHKDYEMTVKTSAYYFKHPSRFWKSSSVAANWVILFNDQKQNTVDP